MALSLILWVDYLCKIRCWQDELLNLILCARKFNFMGKIMHMISEHLDAEHLNSILCARKFDFMCLIKHIKSEVSNTETKIRFYVWTRIAHNIRS